jgi:hypothetical protein
VKSVTVYWGEDGHAVVASREELDRLLQRLDCERVDGVPLMVGLEAPAGSLGVGLGNDRYSVLAYVPASEPDASYRSVGDELPDAEPLGFFTMLGAYSEFSPTSAIPRTLAWAAVDSFAESGGERPEQVEWQRD